MAKYRSRLPQLAGDVFLTDGGMETTLIFHQGLELPYFAAFDLLNRPGGVDALYNYYASYAELARAREVGIVLDSATWRASSDWGDLLGYSTSRLAQTNRAAVGVVEDIRAEYGSDLNPIVISGCLGPRGDGYSPSLLMSPQQAAAYHRPQIETFRETAADLVTALTMTHTGEAVGVAVAAAGAEMPLALSFTVETDGRLPSGQRLGEAIDEVDERCGADRPVYYMINCAHPTHFESELRSDEPWTERIRGIRANASPKSHAELDESVELDAGDPLELAEQYRALRGTLSHLTVLGGCCGTDHRHIDQIARVCRPV
jgi:S-methylmethionine-dependent homocysteine/selenocysteine methylase